MPSYPSSPSSASRAPASLGPSALHDLYPEQAMDTQVVEKNTPPQNGLTAVIMSHNQAHCIERALASVEGSAEQILVLDRGSSDDTMSIARKYTDNSRILYHPSQDTPWVIEQTLKHINTHLKTRLKTPWVLWLCADEWLPNQLAQGIERHLKAQRNAEQVTTGGLLTRQPRWHNQPLNHGGHQQQALRLFDIEMITVPENATPTQPVAPNGNAAKATVLVPAIPAEPYTHVSELLMPHPSAPLPPSTVSKALWCGLTTFISHYVWQLGFLDGPTGLLWAYAAAHRQVVQRLQGV